MTIHNRIVFGTEPDDFIDHTYDDAEHHGLSDERMADLDRELANMSVTDAEIEAVLAQEDPLSPEEHERFFGEDV